MEIAAFDTAKHLEDCLLAWKDAGWLEKGLEKAAEEFIGSGSALVGLEKGRAVAVATSGKGSIFHCLQGDELPFCSINSVNVAFHGRKLGYAAFLTSALLAEAAERGDACAGLGMFEQGFYDRLGFANMPYWKSLLLRPEDISMKGEMSSRPVRLFPKDWEEIHRNRISRHRCHGSVNLSPSATKAAMEFSPGCFALGFRNRSGDLTHHVFIEKVAGEYGPAYAGWLVYEEPGQFRDIMLLLKSLGDQIDLIRISEPAGLQLQSLVRKPLSSRRRTLSKSKDRAEVLSLAWTQCRILSPEKCFGGMECPGKPVSFNLKLHDPVEKFLQGSGKWTGCSGEYTVKLSSGSTVESGFSGGLPMLECSVNALSMMWNGTTRPTMLPYACRITAPQELLAALEKCMPMPEPSFDWEL